MLFSIKKKSSNAHSIVMRKISILRIFILWIAVLHEGRVYVGKKEKIYDEKSG